MSGFKFPSYLNENDKTIVYEKIFGLKWDDNSGIFAKIGYYLSRTWIHISGNVDTSILKNQGLLTDEQKAVVFAAIHDNIECFKIYKSWLERLTDDEYASPYRLDDNVLKFLEKNNFSWGRLDVNENEFVANTALLGSVDLLAKMLGLKPQKMDGTEGSNTSLIREAVLSGDTATIEFLLKQNVDIRNINTSTRITKAKTSLDCTLENFRDEGNGLNKEKHGAVFRTLVKTNEFSDEEIFSVLYKGVSTFTSELYAEFLPSLLEDKSESQITVIFANLMYDCLGRHEHNQEMFDYLHHYVIENYKDLEKEIINTCRTRITNQIANGDTTYDPTLPLDFTRMLGWFDGRVALTRFKGGLCTPAQMLELLQKKEALRGYPFEIYAIALPMIIKSLKDEKDIVDVFTTLFMSYLSQVKLNDGIVQFRDNGLKLTWFRSEIKSEHPELKQEIKKNVKKGLKAKIAELEPKATAWENAISRAGENPRIQISKAKAYLKFFNEWMDK